MLGQTRFYVNVFVRLTLMSSQLLSISSQTLSEKMHLLASRLTGVRYRVSLAADALGIAVAWWLAFLIRFELTLPAHYVRLVLTGMPICLAVKLAVFAFFRLHQRSWKHTSLSDLPRIEVANAVASIVLYLSISATEGSFPRSILMIDLLLCFLITPASRAFVRLLAEFGRDSHSGSKRQRALIYGAGEAGIRLVREIRRDPALGYDICGFIDDDQGRAGLTIHGVRVLGNGIALRQIAAERCIDLVLIAISSRSGPEMSRILELCCSAGLAFKTVPGLAQMMEKSSVAPQLRDVAVEDLLGRSPVHLEQHRISASIRDRTVLVTGAAGSIGSELCRQIARFRPTALVGFEIAETPLFHLALEMARSFPDVKFYPVIGSVQNVGHIREAMDRYEPSIVYHAAAYKHVPIMESHAFEAVENNVLGTLNVARAAARFGVEDFVMISSDKAVRPTNVMGATKRLAELAIRSLQNGGTKFVSVRFGNVLGSNGSVIPIFKEQIARGGPVTVTHAEMRRYFMTIPEACQLVLQSSIMGNGGEIFVLDMGEPVRILDLAKDLILLSGLRPEVDIDIKFTGIRPGEKMYEELHLLDENTLPTYHEKIKIFGGTTIERADMDNYIKRIEDACNLRQLSKLILILKDIVPEYNPSGELLHKVLSVAPASATAAAVAASDLAQLAF
jgi:FlaA1/EpsC-like NDP-sugar epimerase